MCNPGIPLCPDRCGHAASKLLSARVRIREILDEVLGRFLVFLLRDDDMRLPSVSAFGSVDPSDFLDQTRPRSGFFGAAATP